MALEQIQAAVALLRYAVPEASEDTDVLIPQAIRGALLKSYHLGMPDKTQPGHTGLHLWRTW